MMHSATLLSLSIHDKTVCSTCLFADFIPLVVNECCCKLLCWPEKRVIEAAYTTAWQTSKQAFSKTLQRFSPKSSCQQLRLRSVGLSALEQRAVRLCCLPRVAMSRREVAGLHKSKRRLTATHQRLSRRKQYGGSREHPPTQTCHKAMLGHARGLADL